MDYPADFPEHLQPPVDAAIAQAEQFLVQIIDKPGEWEGLLAAWLWLVFSAFSKQAMIAAKTGIWTGRQARMITEDFLRRSSTYAYQRGAPIPERLHEDLRSVMNAVTLSPQWKSLHEDLQRIAEAKAGQAGATPVKAIEPVPVKPKTPRKRLAPDREILKNPAARLSRPQAAKALGVSERQFDRLTASKQLIGTGHSSQKRYSAAHLTRLLDQRSNRD